MDDYKEYKKIFNLSLNSMRYVNQINNENEKIFDFEKTNIHKYNDKNIFDLMDLAIKTDSTTLYNIIFELISVPIFIEMVICSSDMYNSIIVYDHYLSIKDKRSYIKLVKYYKTEVFISKMRFDYFYDMLKNNIINFDKEIYLKSDEKIIALKKIYDQYIERNKKEYKLFKFRRKYGFKSMIRKLREIINSLLIKIDIFFNSGKKFKSDLQKYIDECVEMYKNSKNALKDAINTLNSDEIKKYIKDNDHYINDEYINKHEKIITSTINLSEYCETTIIKMICTLNIMKCDPYRKFK